MTGSQRIRAYGSAVGLMLVGVICGFAVPGLVGDIIRLTLITLGLGAVLLLVFYEIGLSEEGRLIGHLAIGQEMVAARAAAVDGLADERLLALRHCIAAHHGADALPGRRFGSPEQS